MSVYTGILELAPGEHELKLNLDYAIWHVCSKDAARPLGSRLSLKIGGVACLLPYMTGHEPILVARSEYVNVDTSEDIELYVKFLADTDANADAMRVATKLVLDPEREERALANQVINYVRAERASWDIHS